MLATAITDTGFVGFSAAAFFFLGAIYFLLRIVSMLMGGFPRGGSA